MGQNTFVITPNNRMSQQLLTQYYARYNRAIAKPVCLPYQAFLRKLFNHARYHSPKTNHPILLNEIQQRQLWIKILAQQHEFPVTAGLLNQVQEAWTRCQLWDTDEHHPLFFNTPQTQQFQQWRQSFQQRLKQLNALTPEQIVPYVLNTVSLENSIIWACFDEYTPQQMKLQQRLLEEGAPQFYYDLPTRKDVQVHLFPAKDQDDEYSQMMLWLKSRLEAGDQRIGVVVPDLQSEHPSLQRFMQQHFSKDVFNISLGNALYDAPLVAHALHWLQLDLQTITNHQARLLLHSPYLACSKMEFAQRSQAMNNCMLLKEEVIPFSQWVQALETLAPQLAGVLKAIKNYPATQAPAVWVQLFKERLMQLGYPGEYSLNSSTYQCFQRFSLLFDEFLQLSFINPMMSQQEALAAILDLAKTTVFQPKTSTTPIQILGLLEASGCTYDSLWITGLTDQCLPQKLQFSPFIPLEIQRSAGMPHACLEKELRLAQQIIRRLQHSCAQLVFSYPRLMGDTPHLPSPLILGRPEFVAQALPITAHHLIPYHEHYLVPPVDHERIAGGTSLLSNQVKCPFRAFAAHRLFAADGLDVSSGPDACERGQLLHKVMELVWQKLLNQQQLLALSSLELEQTIEDALNRAFQALISVRPQSFSSFIQAIEKTRLKQLIQACLAWEKTREPFEVDALEQTFAIRLGALDFKVRIDRLDKHANQKKWVIDYKTSLPVNQPWKEERPEASQLLMYALLDHDINALLFLQLKKGHLTCSGISEDNIAVKGVASLAADEQWSDYQKHWHQQLTDLSNEFQTGYCPPLPNRASLCTQCEFQNLCRRK